MKKIISIIAFSFLTLGAVNAQDLAQVTETYNAAAATLADGNKEAALASFTTIYDQAVALGEDGEAIAVNCKEVIPGIGISIAKDFIKANDFDNALAKLDAAVELATKFESADVLKEATGLIPQILLKKANALLNAKDYTAAAENYNKILAINPNDGVALLRLGMALNGAGDAAGAKDALTKAIDNGQAANAKKQLASIFVKEASAALKAKKYDDAITAAVESNKYGESKNAYQIAGQAAQLANKIEDAIKYFEKIIELYPNDKSVGQFAFIVGGLYQNSKNNEKAKEYYSKAVNDPKFGEQAKKQLEALK